MLADDERPTVTSATLHDLRGKTVIPGLIDAHIHLGKSRWQPDLYEREMRRMLMGGIVAAREMGGDLRVSGDVSRRTRLGLLEGPDLFYAATMSGEGFVRTSPRAVMAAQGLARGSAAWFQAVTSGTDLALAVARAKGTGANGLKLYAQLDAGLVARIVQEAHRQDMLVWSHATIYPDRPLDYVKAGVDLLTHACGLGWQDRDVSPARYREFDETTRPAYDSSLVEGGQPGDEEPLRGNGPPRDSVRADPCQPSTPRGRPFSAARLS